jgi:hypothetical protein
MRGASTFLACLYTIACATSSTSQVDADTDGIDDARESALASRFAPVVVHDAREQFLPMSVSRFLEFGRLGVYQAGCSPEQEELLPVPLVADRLLDTTHTTCRSQTLISGGTRSVHKQSTFFIGDLPSEHRGGAAGSIDWMTYYHAYPNQGGGVTLQYWRFYGYNFGQTIDLPFGFRLEFSHGGDWEAIHIVLDQADQPAWVRLLGHRSLDSVPWNAVQVEGGTHVVLFSEAGGHTSHAEMPEDFVQGIRQRTWPGSQFDRPGSPPITAPPLVNLGEKLDPLERWLPYSGLWGSPGFNYFGLPTSVKGLIESLMEARGLGEHLENFTSGYWGPAFNETGRTEAGYITAWCAGHVNPERARNGRRECYADEEVP